MADLRAFRGFRYDLGRAGALSELVAPPYDVIDAPLQQKLYDQSPYNSIRLELTKDEPGDTATSNRYTRAAQALNGWINDNVVRQDTLRNLYVVEQEFTVEGRSYKRRGFIARVRLELFGTGRIFPHEETMSGPKEDRLKLYRATAMNLSPVFGLYPDDSNEIFGRIEPLLLNTLPLEAKDHLGVVSRVWPITDEKVITSVLSGMAEKPVFIADGHHRYETGLKYRDEVQAAGMASGDEHASNFVMMMLVSMSDPGLIILPTHRLVSGFPGLNSAKLAEALSPHFTLTPVADGQTAWDEIEMDGSQSLLAFHTKADNAWHLAKFNSPALMAELAKDHTDDWRELGVSILHVAALNKLLAEKTGGTPSCKYVHLLSEVEESIAGGGSDLSVLVPPASMAHVESIAGNREKMPPKSTYFYPKLLTGLVYNSLKTS
jgi:uncharacterized protein (DUF1015 family)